MAGNTFVPNENENLVEPPAKGDQNNRGFGPEVYLRMFGDIGQLPGSRVQTKSDGLSKTPGWPDFNEK